MTPVLNIYLSDFSEIIRKSSIPFCIPPNKHKNAHKEFIIDGILMILIIYYVKTKLGCLNLEVNRMYLH